jgi:hypothetical protein
MEENKSIRLADNGTVMAVINQVLQSDAVKIAIASYLEGGGKTGKWALKLVGAELVPEKEG